MIRRLLQFLPCLALSLVTNCSTEPSNQAQTPSTTPNSGRGLALSQGSTSNNQTRPAFQSPAGFSASCFLQSGSTRISISNRSNDSLELNGSIKVFYFNDFNSSLGTDSLSISRTIFPGNRIEFSGSTPPSGATQCDVDITGALPHPSAPTGLGAFDIDYHDLDLSWFNGGGGTVRFYVLETSQPTSDDTCQAGESVGSNTWRHFSNLLEGQFYYFRVCSENRLGLRTSSNEIRVATRARPAPNPTGLVLTADGLNRLKVEWKSGGGTTYYYRVKLVEGAAVPDDGCSTGAATFGEGAFFPALKTNTLYSVRVCAANVNDLLTAGTVGSAKTQDPAALTLPFFDDFSGRTTMGAAWTVSGGAAVLASEHLKTVSAPSVALLNTRDMLAKSTVEIKLMTPPRCECAFGLIARAQNVQNLYIGRVRLHSAKYYAEISVLQNNKETILKSVALKSLKANSIIGMLALDGKLQFLVNGVVAVEVSDTRLPAGGRIGIYTAGANQVADNFYGK